MWPEEPSQTLNQYISKKGTDEFHDHISKRGRRTRRGCNQCKKIKKKCDETKPWCTRCVKKGVTCTWQEQKDGGEPSSDAAELLFSVSEDESDLNATETCSLIRTPDNNYMPFNDVKIRINDESSQIFLFKIFFNNIIDGLIPQKSLQSLSDLTFESLKNSPEFRNVVASLSAAFVYTVDDSKRNLVESMHDEALLTVMNLQTNDVTIEAKLHSLDFCILRALYTKTNNKELLRYLNMALDLTLQYTPRTPNLTFKVIVESLIYHFSVSRIVVPVEALDLRNPFIICGALRHYFPQYPDSQSNPLLGSALDIFISVAKVSYVFKKQDVSFEIQRLLLEEIECLMALQPMRAAPFAVADSFEENDCILVSIPSAKYITLLSCKLLLLHILPETVAGEFDAIVQDTISVLKRSRAYSCEVEICGLWGMFMLGINLKNTEDQEFMAEYFTQLWEKSHNLGYLKSISHMRYAWEKDVGFEILRDKNFSQDLCLN